jgi:hypothetical protein
MKNVLRSISFAIVVALSTALVPTEATALRLVSRGIQWRNPDVAFGTIDRQNLGVAINDTTDVFSTDGWAIPNFAQSASPTVTDSLIIGWIVLSTDSSAAYTPSATSATLVIEGGAGGSGNVNFSPMATTTFTDPTTTDKVWKIPLFLNPWLARGATAGSPSLGNVFPAMRMRIVPIGGTFSSCRVTLVYFSE